MSEVTDKVVCMPSNNCAETMALMNNNNWMNNPFMYLIWLAFFGGNGFGYGNRDGAQNVEMMSRLNSIERQAQDNHNNQLAMDAIRGNGNALHELAGNLNVGVTSLGSAILNIQASIGQVGSTVGLTGERVINAIGSGDMNIISQLKDCCCSNKLMTQQMGYEQQLATQKLGYDGQIATLNLTNTLSSRIEQLANGILQGFATVGYESQRQTCDIINSQTANTLKILDTLTGHWQAETALALQDEKFANSQLKLNIYLTSLINGKTTPTI